MRASEAIAAVHEALTPHVEAGRVPGYVAGVGCGGETAVGAGGVMTLESGDPMTARTIFRIASLSKPIAGALTMSLVQDGTLGLDDDVARWLPELEAPRVLTRLDGPLEDTVPAERPITIRNLLTMTAGFGLVLTRGPLMKAMVSAELMPGPFPPAFSPDEFMARLAALPLADQPGERWRYHTSADALGVLIARAGGAPLGELLRERITGPLGMADTGFQAGGPDRLATAYTPAASGLRILDPPNGAFARPPVFEAFGSGLVATISDYLAFQAMLAGDGGSVLNSESVELISGDRLTDGQRASAQTFLGPGRSWGLMAEVCLGPEAAPLAPGAFGWMGGTGTTAYVDRGAGLFGALFTQRAMETNRAGDIYNDFWRAVYGAVG
jgi:CubicO group peptidase (beta-lactamase class C family)